MNNPTEQQLRDLFAADAAAAPDGPDLAAAARHRVHRRRRAQAAWSAAAATAVVITTVGALALDRPAPPPQAQRPAPAPSSAAPPSAAPSSAAETPGAGLPSGVRPGDPMPDGAAASCAEEFSPATLAKRAFAFDGTVTRIGPARTSRSPQGGPEPLQSVTFRVHAWFAGGSGDTAVVDMTSPGTTGSGISEAPPAYRVGTRLLVSGMPRWGGAPLDDAIAWGCGFTRYHSPAMAAEWAAATK